LANLMTHPENGRLSRTIVNRIWHRLMGRGIVHPVDAMHTPPWSNDLLDYLAVHLSDNGYDLKQTIRLICTSDTYQARIPAVDTDAGSESVFRGPLARRMTAEQFMDAVWQITGAAPAKADAQVVRVKASAGTPATETESSDMVSGSWIWSASRADIPAGETITVRRRFELPATPENAVAVVTCDNEYVLYANGHRVGTDTNWETVEQIKLTGHLRPGGNEILIVARNAGTTPNPAGLFFELRVDLPDQQCVKIATDQRWEWTSKIPDQRGRFPQQPADWAAVSTLASPNVWSDRVGGQIATLLVQPLAGSPLFVRASLMKNNAFMRALGRPARDQIVSMRPSELTTLEAINLSNDQQLADMLAAGADRLIREASEPAGEEQPVGASTDRLTRNLFARALSRQPTAAERTVIFEMLGSDPTPENVSDLLWSVLMLPEFQIVR
jgi:hypothetical protein